MFVVTRTQYPVGHGGFHLTTIEDDGARWQLVYDCGSTQRQLLVDAIDRAERRGEIEAIDALVLSHLDADHCNGVEALLVRRPWPVRQVFIPYLTQTERLVVACRAAASGRVKRKAARWLSDPEKFLLDAGADQVVVVAPRRDTDPPGEPEPGGTSEGPNGFKVKGPRSSAVDGNSRAVLAAAMPVHVLSPSRIGWEFLFYRNAADDTALAEFHERAWRVLSAYRGAFAVRLRKALLDSRRELAECYRAVESDRNGTSLCLYGGPLPLQSGRWEVETADPSLYGSRKWTRSERRMGALWRVSQTKTGWLATGDFPMRTDRRRGDFEQFYAGRLPRVGTFVLPHHGASRNFASGLLTALDPAQWMVLHARADKHHPDRALVRSLSAHAPVVHVHDASHSFSEEISLMGATSPPTSRASKGP